MDEKQGRFEELARILREARDSSRCDECGEDHQACYCEQSELLDNALFGEEL